jgi:hypothetical protein
VVKKSGKKATIHFRKIVETYWEPTGCYETNKVEGFNDDGSIRYRWNCTGPDLKRSDDLTTEPVTVPAFEAAKIKPGELVHVYVDPKTRVGHVGWSGKPRKKDDRYTSDTERVQLLEWRL